jgi:hypothetical protein
MIRSIGLLVQIRTQWLSGNREGQRLLDRALTAPVTLDDGHFKRLPAQLGHLQPHLAGPGVQLAVVAARQVVCPIPAALVALCTAQGICLCIQQATERLFD